MLRLGWGVGVLAGCQQGRAASQQHVVLELSLQPLRKRGNPLTATYGKAADQEA